MKNIDLRKLTYDPQHGFVLPDGQPLYAHPEEDTDILGPELAHRFNSYLDLVAALHGALPYVPRVDQWHTATDLLASLGWDAAALSRLLDAREAVEAPVKVASFVAQDGEVLPPMTERDKLVDQMYAEMAPVLLRLRREGEMGIYGKDDRLTLNREGIKQALKMFLSMDRWKLAVPVPAVAGAQPQGDPYTVVLTRKAPGMYQMHAYGNSPEEAGANALNECYAGASEVSRESTGYKVAAIYPGHLTNLIN